MHRNLLITLVILLTAIISPARAREPYWGTAVKIIDGDSLVIATGEKNIQVRLYGIDCPEYNQPFSNKAKSFLRKRIYGKHVLVSPQYYDSYKRMVAIVVSGDETINSELVRAGLAWVYPHYCRKEICKSWQEEQRLAKIEKKGMWGGAQQPIPPWRWKRMKHGN